MIRRLAIARHAAHMVGPVIALVLILGAAPAATARTPVDPSTLNPAPPDFFNAQCYAGAGGTTCTLAFADPNNPYTDEPTGILCGGTELLLNQMRYVAGKRTYDANGNLVQRHFREQMEGTLTNPVTGRSVPFAQHDTIIQNLSLPGDLDSGTIRTTGLYLKVVTPGGPVVLVDAGTFTQDAASGDLLRESAHHPLNDYFFGGDATALQAICDSVD